LIEANTAGGSKKIAVIGAGSIGRRHLQALLKLKPPAHISVIDPSRSAIDAAKEVCSKDRDSSSVRGLEFFESLARLGPHLDLAVVATTSRERAAVTEELLEGRSVDSIIFEKVLFQTMDEYDSVADLLASHGTKAWVNCPRRTYEIYQNLARMIGGGQRVSLHATGGEWGLACNGIHLIDLLSFFTRDCDYRYDASRLDLQVWESKRRGFSEISGTLIGYQKDGSEIVLHSRRGSSAPLVLLIMTEHLHAVVDEAAGWARIATSDNGWNAEVESFKIPYQSNLTHTLAEEIFQTGESTLTGYGESSTLHRPFLRAVMGHLARVTGAPLDRCPIT
jgi:hypothetical protein